MNDLTMEILARRLDRVEQENRRLKEVAVMGDKKAKEMYDKHYGNGAKMRCSACCLLTPKSTFCWSLGVCEPCRKAGKGSPIA